MNNTAAATKTSPANKFAGTCTVCGTQVAAAAGTLAGKVNGRWAVKCTQCSGTGTARRSFAAVAAPARNAGSAPRRGTTYAPRGCQTGGDCWSFGHIAHCHECGK